MAASRVKRFTQPRSPMWPANVRHGIRPDVTSRTSSSPIRQRSPIRAWLTDEPERRQVLAERAVGQRAAELLLPGVELLAGVRVHRLVDAAVVPQVAHRVPGQAAAAGALGAGVGDPHRAVGRLLADPGEPVGPVGVRERAWDGRDSR